MAIDDTHVPHPTDSEAAALIAFADRLSALGHPMRLRILRFVVQHGVAGATAGAIQGHVDLPASTLSHHLKRLTDATFLTRRNAATFVYYAADYDALRALTDYVWEDCCKFGKGTSGCT